MTQGLTVVGDIPLLYEKLTALEEKLKQEIDLLKKDISELQSTVFESAILLENDDSWDIVRKKRDYILKSTDWALTTGSTVDQGAWAEYRQQLRDLPQRFKGIDSNKVIWPKQPPTLGPNTIKKK